MLLACCCLFLSVFSLLVPASSPASVAHAESPLSYRIEATLNYPTGVASVRERVGYTNLTGTTLTTIALNVTPRHFDAFTLAALAIDGTPTPAKLSNVTLEAPLPTPLAPGGHVELVIDYRLAVPARSDIRFGRAGGITALGNAFPTVQPFRNGAWIRYAYTDVGDVFFSESADYDLTLDVTGTGAQLAVAHSGDLESRSGNRFVFRATQVRDFALALSDRYQTKSRTVGGMTITAFYLPEHAAGGAQMLESASAALAWANARLGAYPWPSLSVAETTDPSGTGQEYPTAVFIASSAVTGATGPGSYLDYVVAHEVFHQWLYSLVGNDQVSEPWLDEGPTTHLSYLYLRDTAPASYQAMWSNMVQTHRQAVAAYGDRPLDTTVYDYPSDAVYFAILYRKSALFLDEVRLKLGDDGYFTLLRDHIAANSYGVATTADFLRMLRNRLPDAGPALVGRYFSADAVRASFGAATPTSPPSMATSAPSATPTARALPSATASALPSATSTVPPSPAATATAAPSATPSPTMPPTLSAATPSPTAGTALATATVVPIAPTVVLAVATATTTVSAVSASVAGVQSSGEAAAFGILVVLAAAGGGQLVFRLRARRQSDR